MTIYETKSDFQKAVLGKLSRYIQSYTSTDGMHPPYSEADIEDFFQGLGLRRPRGSKRKGAKSRQRSEYLSFENRDHYVQFAKMMVSFARDLLRIRKPIPLAEIKDFFIERGLLNPAEVSLVYMPYPVLNYARGGNIDNWSFGERYCEIDWLWLTAGNDLGKKAYLSLLQYGISNVMVWLPTHPALALASILCDMPVYLDWIAVVRDGTSFCISVYKPDMTPSKVMSSYSVARKMHGLGITDASPASKWPRWRKKTERVSKLIEFVEAEKRSEMSWEELLEEWNSTYEDQLYKSINAMRAVYYKAVRRTQKFKAQYAKAEQVSDMVNNMTQFSTGSNRMGGIRNEKS